MRRKSPDLSYRSRTKQIVDDNFLPWQLTRRDPREGIHRLVNTMVSFSQELASEIEYVEDMFFPDHMDLTEEWVIFGTNPRVAANNCFVSGIPISGFLNVAEDTDELIAGEFNVLEPYYSSSGSVSASSIAAVSIESLFCADNSSVWNYDLKNDSVLSSGVITTIPSGSILVYADIDHTTFVIREDVVTSSIAIVDSGGNPVQFTLIKAQDASGYWNSAFDRNNDGVIGDYEKNLLDAAYGTSMADYDPDGWENVKWADIDGDGTIGETDYRYVSNFFTSLAPGVTAAVVIHYGQVGAFTVTFNYNFPYLSMVYREGRAYRAILSDNKIMTQFSRFALDDNTSIYYGINTYSNKVYSFRADSDVAQVLTANELHVDVQTKNYQFIDIDTWNGYVYVLTSIGGDYRVYAVDIRQDYVEKIDDYLTITFPAGFTPIAMGITIDGYFVFTNGTRILAYVPKRNRYLEIDGSVYTNRRYTITDSLGTTLKTIPSYIFNNFDSFAYTLGITRPWGCDNQKLKDLIYDFYKFPQGNDAIGMGYGILRELGFTNQRVIPESPVYALPNRIDLDYPVVINNCSMQLVQSGYIDVLSGSIGTIQVMDRELIIPGSGVIEGFNTLVISGAFLDYEGDPVQLEHTLAIVQGNQTPVISINTYAEIAFLEAQGLIVSGVPTDSLIELINTYESTSPYLYKNAIVDITSTRPRHPSHVPVLPTCYSPSLSGILESMEDVTITL